MEERSFGSYIMRYETVDLGERKPRHIIQTFDGGEAIAELNWYGTTGKIDHVDVKPAYRRQGIATAMWNWGQELPKKPRHSNDRTTQGDAWARSVGGPLPRTASSPSASEIAKVVEGLGLPRYARDGDCFPVSGAISSTLKKKGWPSARVVTVFGFGDFMGQEVMTIGHAVVLVDGLVVDATATQYDRSQPSLIIEPVDAYERRMEMITGSSRIEVDGPIKRLSARGKPMSREYKKAIEDHLAKGKAEGKADFGSTKKAQDFVSRVCPYPVRVQVSHQDPNGNLGIGAKAWVYQESGEWVINLRPEFATRESALHEIAHVLDVEKNGWPKQGRPGVDLEQSWAHGKSFQDELRGLQMHASGSNEISYRIETSSTGGFVEATLGGLRVGFLEWSFPLIRSWAGRAAIADVKVHESYRRQGIATKMLEFARANVDYPIEHSPSRTKDGDAWAKRVGMAVFDPSKTYYHGTPADLAPGTILTNDHDARNPGRHPDRVWATTKLNLAQAYGEHVYEVEPTGPALAGAGSMPDADSAALPDDWPVWYAPGWRVVREVSLSRVAAKPHPDAITEKDGWYTYAYRPGEVQVFSDGLVVGTLWWSSRGDRQVIDAIEVISSERRQGIATKMLEMARRLSGSHIEHSTTLTDDGRAWSEKVGSTFTMAAVAPTGITYRIEWPLSVFGGPNKGGRVHAMDEYGEEVGNLSWTVRAEDGFGVIGYVEVNEDHMRQGIAAEMLRRARARCPVEIRHSDHMTDDGRAWSEKVGSSWRALVADAYWDAYDVTIASDGGPSGRKAYEIHVGGKPFANRPSLTEAKAAVEEEFGSQEWRTVRTDKMVANHYTLGETEEFTAPTTIWVADFRAL